MILLEPSPFFVFAPGAVRYVFGLTPFDRIARSHAGLEARGLRVVRAAAVAVERDHHRVVTAGGRVEYDHLVIATGLRLAYEDVPGLGPDPGPSLCPYDPASDLLALRRRIGAFRGGHVVISPPQSLYKCQPAVYEYAFLWAEAIRRRGLRATVTLVEPRSRPPAALAAGLARAIEASRPVLRYEPFTRILSVDVAARRVETEAGTLPFDLLSVVPPNRPVPVVAGADLGAPLVDVDPRTFRATRDEAVSAVGDTADTPYAKTGHTAALSGRVAGHDIARAWGAAVAPPPAPHNVCFPMVSATRALRLGTDWYFEPDAAGVLEVKAAGSADNVASAANLRLRAEWEARLLGELFGG